MSKEGKYLAKQRAFYRDYDQAKWVRHRFEQEVFFPKGIIRESEDPTLALERVTKREIGVSIRRSSFKGTFLYKDGCRAMVYLIDVWSGGFNELRGSSKYIWIGTPARLSNEFDQEIFYRILRARLSVS